MTVSLSDLPEQLEIPEISFPTRLHTKLHLLVFIFTAIVILQLIIQDTVTGSAFAVAFKTSFSMGGIIAIISVKI
ncbi:hypothetical protein D3C71_1976940 [compost metagenome]